jgi:hypothetical protein
MTDQVKHKEAVGEPRNKKNKNSVNKCRSYAIKIK